MRASSLCLSLAMLSAACPAFAQAEAPGIPAAPPAQPTLDTVTFTLSAEDWVQTSTAKVSVAIDATLSGADAGKVRTNMLKALNDLANGADWKFAQFQHSQNESGMEQWHAEVETRLKEADLGGLADKAKSVSTPGLHLDISNIDFTPSLDENQAAKARLRAQLYGRINDELKALNDAEPGRAFHVGEIAFDAPEFHPIRPMPRIRMNAMALAAAPAQPGGDAGIDVAQKVTMRADVTLEAVLPKAP